MKFIKEQLANILAPLIRPTVFLAPCHSEDPTGLPLTGTHFGGRPYAEVGDAWPICPVCEEGLDFVLQVNLADSQLPAPLSSGLFTFYYCQGCAPLGMEAGTEGSWRVVYYPDPQPEKARHLENSSDPQTRPCRILIHPAQSLPDWDGTSLWCPEAAALSSRLNPDEPWTPYQELVAELTGDQDIATHIGGYPVWIQGEETPLCPECGQTMCLLAQIDSERQAGLMWGDAGSIYLFTCAQHAHVVHFILQCY